ncbi:unnamed protein product [Schistosoma margrebowiei]|uniref:Uncharacterized protein n=1 Tax=Schistosoma margrebowiei TaxID=48269 RepID=A0A183MHU8_9TREM|nr:unnamed protein product [Schistosoma margrebowiei]
MNKFILSTNTKVRIFNTNIMTSRPYGAGTMKTTADIIKKVEAFINGYLRKILNVHRPNALSNSLLWEKANQLPNEEEIRERP